jgi:putative endonuclease
MFKSSLEPISGSLDLGRKGEDLAAAYLSQLGFQLVAANFTVPAGRNRNDAVVNVEIDLVAYEGPVLCFVEVKARTSDWFAPPTANVDLRKQRQITRAARVYRHMFGLEEEPFRFDVVSVILPALDAVSEEQSPSKSEPKSRQSTDKSRQAGSLQIELIRNFWAPEKFSKHRPHQVHWD